MIPAPRRAASGVRLLRWDDGHPHAPHLARAALRTALLSRGVPTESAHDAVQAAAELIANAVEHAIGPYELWLRGTARELICEVHDRDATLPQFHSGSRLSDLYEHGRGLHLVEELTGGCWGFRLMGESQRATWRKVAWMAIPAPEAAGRPERLPECRPVSRY